MFSLCINMDVNVPMTRNEIEAQVICKDNENKTFFVSYDTGELQYFDRRKLSVKAIVDKIYNYIMSCQNLNYTKTVENSVENLTEEEDDDIDEMLIRRYLEEMDALGDAEEATLHHWNAYDACNIRCALDD